MEFITENWEVIIVPLVLLIWELIGKLVPTEKNWHPSYVVEKVLAGVKFFLDLIPNNKK